MSPPKLALQPPGDGRAAVVEQAGAGKQEDAAAKLADQPAVRMLLPQPGAGAGILRLQALRGDVIDEAAGDDDRVVATALADRAIDREHLAATRAHGSAFERERLPGEAAFCTALLHHVIGER